MNTRNGNLVNLVTLALLMALIFLMGQTPLGLIPLGFCNVTLLVIPVAVGTLFMGAEIRRAAGIDLRCNKLCVGAASSIYAGRHADGGVAADGDCDDLPAAFDGAGGDSLRPQGNGA